MGGYEHNLNLRDNELSNFKEDELNELHNELEDLVERERKIKNKIAKFCLDLMNITSQEETEIHKAASIITQFIWYDFKDSLNEIIRIAKKLELDEADEAEFFGLWEEMKGLLLDYLSS